MTGDVTRTKSRTVVLRILRIAVTIAAFAWVLSRVDLPSLGRAIERTSIARVLLAAAIAWFNLVPGSWRWGLLLRAYGADAVPSATRLFRLYWIAFFYNLWLPGGVGGDVVRGLASRDAFTRSGATGAFAVVLVDRVLGLVGLLLVVAGASLLWPIAEVQGVGPASALGLGAAFAAVAFIALSRTLAPRMPARIAVLASKLPQIVRPELFVLALVLAVVTQSIVAVTGHVLISALHPEISIRTSLVMIPLAMATAYIPITVGGAGAREAAFQSLYGLVGIPYADATAASLLSMVAYYLASSFGGVLAALERTRVPENR